MFGQSITWGLAALAVLPAEKAENESEAYQTAIFAGGCFWCMEHPFEVIEGVIDVVAGYTGGDEIDPTYQEVASGETEHLEAVRVVFDPSKVSYETLLDVYWRQVDPTDASGQFVDRGSHYNTAIFFKNDKQQAIAEQSKEKVNNSECYSKPIVTEIRPAGEFYDAESYHQDYHKTNPLRYKYYRQSSGRDRYLNTIWKDSGKDNHGE